MFHCPPPGSNVPIPPCSSGIWLHCCSPSTCTLSHYFVMKASSQKSPTPTQPHVFSPLVPRNCLRAFHSDLSFFSFNAGTRSVTDNSHLKRATINQQASPPSVSFCSVWKKQQRSAPRRRAFRNGFPPIRDVCLLDDLVQGGRERVQRDGGGKRRPLLFLDPISHDGYMGS